MKKLLLLAALVLPLQAEIIQVQRAQLGGLNANQLLIQRNNIQMAQGCWAGESFGGNDFFIVGEAGPSKPDPQGPDLLRFKNGDIIHGRFEGMSKTDLAWGREDLAAPVRFGTENLAQVAFNGGRLRKAVEAPSHVTLTNGDRIPGKIVSLDEKNLVLETTNSGSLEIPRSALASLYPRPRGGGIVYAGPYNTEGWKILAPLSEKDAEKKGAELANKYWVHSGAAWYSKADEPLIREADLPDQARLSFNLAWRNRLNVSIAFHSTFKRPLLENGQVVREEGEQPEGELAPIKWETLADAKGGDGLVVPWSDQNSRGAHPNVYGESYVLTFQSTYPTLYRCSFNEDGQPNVQAIQTSRVPINLNNVSEADFDIRIDRKKIIALYVDGEYTMQWDEPGEYIGTGGGIAFSAQNGCHVRISDLVVSAWNGMTDSARSMVHDERDILLMTNGTDRFSGQIESVQDGKVIVKNAYSTLEMPIEEVEEIHFHGKRPANPEGAAADDQAALLLFGTNGRLTLLPTAATAEKLSGSSSILGDIEVDLQSATLLQFGAGNSALEGWDDTF